MRTEVPLGHPFPPHGQSLRRAIMELRFLFILPLTAAAATATVLGDFTHRSLSPRSLSDHWKEREFDFGDFASSDSSYEAYQQTSLDTGGYSQGHQPSLNQVTPYHEQRGHSPTRDSKSHLKADYGETVDEFDNLTPFYSGEVSSGAFSNDPASDLQDPEARFFIDMCAVKNFFGRKKRSAAPLFFFHYGYNRCHKGYGKGHSKGYGHGHRKRRK